MSLQGVSSSSDALKSFVQTVRLYLRDFAELNRLIAGEESSDRMIMWAVMDAMSSFNGTPHFTSLTFEDLLAKNQQHLLLRMTVISLIESVGLLQTRNHINYSDGGINVGVNDKTPLLMNWLQYFKSYTDQLKQRVKVALNIEGILGTNNPGIHSELWAVNASYLAY
jgi:hypothetical protein